MKVKSKIKTSCSLVIRYFSSGVLLGGWRVKRSETLNPCFTYRRLVVFRSKRYTKRYTASPTIVLCIGYPYVLYRRLPLKRGCRIHEKIHAKEKDATRLVCCCVQALDLPLLWRRLRLYVVGYSFACVQNCAPRLLGLAASRLYVVEASESLYKPLNKIIDTLPTLKP